MSRPYYTSAAEQDMAEIVAYIARDKPNAALDWIERIEKKCFLIAQSPKLGDMRPELGEGVRANVVGRYVIFHRRRQDRTEVLRVIAGDRDIREL